MRFRGRSLSADFEMSFTMPNPDGDALFRAVASEREVRLTLAAGQRWPNEVKRGQSVDLEIGVGEDRYSISGRVRFRRLNVAVVRGELRREAIR